MSMYSNRLPERVVSTSLRRDQTISTISLSKDDTAKNINSLESEAHCPDMISIHAFKTYDPN